jgi:hypothetical protein
MPIYTENDLLITEGIQSVISRPDVIEIENRTLDGKRHIQSIGTGGTVLDVIAHFTMVQKLIFDSVKLTSSMLKIIFDDILYTGLISGEPGYERIPSTIGPYFTITFLVAVQTEEVA